MIKKCLCILALVVSSTSFSQDEEITVFGDRISGSSGMGFGGSGGGGGGRLGKCFDSTCGGLNPVVRPEETGGGSDKVLPGNKELISLITTQFTDMISKLASMQAYAELNVKVKTPDGYEVEVGLKVGFGKVNVTSKSFSK